MARPLLSITSLSKSVPGGRVLFRDLDFTLAAGEFVAATGESGVGKSTLLNLVAGLDLPDNGTVAIDGVDLGDLDEGGRTRLRRDRIGFIFQAFHVLPHLSLVQNVALPLMLQRRPAREATEQGRRMLDRVGLGDRGDDYPNQLSGGELQRVAIARALVHRPALILADEPTGNLDAETAARVLDLMADHAREAGAATLLVTHSTVAAARADRTVRLTPAGLVGSDAG